MNERIYELAEQAGFENGHQDRYGNSLSQELEKFAELIVRECTSIAQEYDGSKLSGSGMIIAGSIETHFGVEE